MQLATYLATQAAYVQNQFARYFPGAQVTVVLAEENLHAIVDRPGLNPMLYSYNISGEDFYFHKYSAEQGPELIEFPAVPELVGVEIED